MAFLPTQQVYKTLTPKLINDKGKIVNNELLYIVFDEIVKGELRPDRYGDDDDNRGGIIFIDYYICDDELSDSEFSYTEFFSGWEDEDSFHSLKKRTKWNKLLKIIPTPPTNKAAKYAILIARELTDIKKELHTYLETSEDKNHKPFARKNIRMLKLRAKELLDYENSLDPEEKYTNRFIVYVLKITLLHLVEHIRDIFEVKIKNEEKLENDLFNQSLEDKEMLEYLNRERANALNLNSDIFPNDEIENSVDHLMAYNPDIDGNIMTVHNEDPKLTEIPSIKTIPLKTENNEVLEGITPNKGRKPITPDFTQVLNRKTIEGIFNDKNEHEFIKEKFEKLISLCKDEFSSKGSCVEHAMLIDSLVEFDLLKIHSVGLKSICRSLCVFINQEFTESYYESIRKVYNIAGKKKLSFKGDNYLKDSFKDKLILEGILKE